jgi:hypothetical protein
MQVHSVLRRKRSVACPAPHGVLAIDVLAYGFSGSSKAGRLGWENPQEKCTREDGCTQGNHESLLTDSLNVSHERLFDPASSQLVTSFSAGGLFVRVRQRGPSGGPCRRGRPELSLSGKSLQGYRVGRALWMVQMAWGA